MLGKRGATIGIRAGRSIQPSRLVALCRVAVEILPLCCPDCCLLCRELVGV